MSQPPDFVRCDTPDPRVGSYHFDVSSPSRPHMDISAAWEYLGTNNSALKSSPLVHTIPREFKWTPSSTVDASTSPVFSDGANNFGHKRHWQNSDDRFCDDPPRKIHINEERVAQQFHSMSLYQDQQNSLCSAADTPAMGEPNKPQPPQSTNSSVNAMWNHYHELEDKLDNLSDVEIDEGVDMGGDVDSSYTEPTLHLSPDLKAKIMTNPLPQILVPKPCKEVVIWQPSGIEQIKESVILETPTNQSLLSVKDDSNNSRNKRSTTRMLLPNTCMLSVPTVRPDTPPPNTRTSPLSQDIPVCFIEEPSNDFDMDL